MRASILTLGCKLNKYESDCMATQLLQAGYEVASNLEYADVYVINTCAVTKESEKKSRQYVAKCLKLNPNAKIIVCGCASQNNIMQFDKMPQVYAIFGNANKDNILQYVTSPIKQLTDFKSCYDGLHNPTISTTRAYLKVQDGCNNFCSYCLIPYLRGRSRSRDLNACVTEATKLSTTCHEIVLTGIDLSDYKPGLGELVQSLSHLPCRIRLGSLEVRVVTEELISTFAKCSNFCPQFHLSLQSGDNDILKVMNRHYTREEYIDKVNLIRKYFPNANITTDVIVGFAGETDEQFDNTVELCKAVKFGKIHVFPYSPREGTVAYNRYPECDSSTKKQRVATLMQVGAELEQQYFASQLNSVTTVLTEDVEGEYVVGYTPEYIKVYLPITTPTNTLINVKLTKCIDGGMIGDVIK